MPQSEIIDLRSDTVTKASPAMRQAMAEAAVGDDVYGEDPTVIQLESLAAGMLGKEAAMFVATGTQSNLCALLAHCQRGDEYIVGQTAHTYRYEGGGAAVLGSIQPQPLDFEADGSLDLDKVAHAIKPDDSHFARTRLLCLENTQNGRALPLDYLPKPAALAAQFGLNTHLDGARLFNAAIKLQVPVQEISRHFESISICLSKGLGAPVGSLLCGSIEIIQRARRWRKVLGGGMRQAGHLAAAGIYALENNIQRLSADHQNAALLAKGLVAIPALQVAYPDSQTNMVYLRLVDGAAEGLSGYLRDQGILIQGQQTIRLVTHMDVSRKDIQSVIKAFQNYFC